MTNEQIREALEEINDELQALESEAGERLGGAPDMGVVRLATGIMEARLRIREVLQAITPTPPTLGELLGDTLEVARPPLANDSTTDEG